MFKQTHLFEEQQNTHQTADAKNAAYFDKLRAQGTPEHKEQFLALAKYQGNDEILLCRKAQVLFTQGKPHEAHQTLKNLKEPLAITLNNLYLSNEKNLKENPDLNYTGEARVFYLLVKTVKAEKESRVLDALLAGMSGRELSLALNMPYQANNFEGGINENLAKLGHKPKFKTKETNNITQQLHKLNQDYRLALTSHNYEHIYTNPYPKNYQLLARATAARQQEKFLEACSLANQCHFDNRGWQVYLSFLHLELYCRNPNNVWLHPKDSYEYIKEHLMKIDSPLETIRNCVKLYPLGVTYYAFKKPFMVDVYLVEKNKVYLGRELVIKSGVPKNLENAINTSTVKSLPKHTKRRYMEILEKHNLESSELVTNELITRVKKLI